MSYCDSDSEIKKETENTKLLQDNNSGNDGEGHKSNLSVVRQNVMLVSLLTLHFCVMSTDQILFPFYGEAAKKKGVNNVQVGIVLTSYDAARFVAAPLYGILVRTNIRRLIM